MSVNPAKIKVQVEYQVDKKTTIPSGGTWKVLKTLSCKVFAADGGFPEGYLAGKIPLLGYILNGKPMTDIATRWLQSNIVPGLNTVKIGTFPFSLPPTTVVPSGVYALVGNWLGGSGNIAAPNNIFGAFKPITVEDGIEVGSKFEVTNFTNKFEVVNVLSISPLTAVFKYAWPKLTKGKLLTGGEQYAVALLKTNGYVEKGFVVHYRARYDPGNGEVVRNLKDLGDYKFEFLD